MPTRRFGRQSSLRAKRLRFEPLEDRRLLTVFTVGNTDNSGPGSLAQAILDANADTSGPHEIRFAIGTTGSQQTISLTDALSPITRDDVTINGFSQGGVGNTQVLIQVSWGGLSTTIADGLVINASGSVVTGLEISGFKGAGVKIDGTASGDADNNTIADSVITGNGVGVVILGDDETRDTADLYLEVLVAPTLSNYTVNSTATGNTIGGNTITWNSAQGVLIQHASENVVSSNTIGDNGAAGVEIDGLGGTTVETFAGDPDQPELVSWETYAISNSATGNVVTGNWIGIDAGDSDIGNTGDGVLIDGASLNTIGGLDTAQRNYISFNSQNGVRVTGTANYQPQSMLLSSFSGGTAGTFAQWRDRLDAMLAAIAANLGGDGGARQSSLVPVETSTQQWTGAVAVLNRIQSNYIGTNEDADTAAGNLAHGVLVEQAARVTIIGAEEIAATPPGGNTIVANALGGVKIVGTPLYNQLLVEPLNNYLPTPSDEEPQETYSLYNVQGNESFEINDPIAELVATLVAGNSIGITADDLLLGNGGDGVFVENSHALVVQNTISGNGDALTTAHGVHVTGTPRVALFGSIISANQIGTQTDGTATLNLAGQVEQGNWGDGVLLESGVQASVVGAILPDPGGDPVEEEKAAAEFLGNVISGNRGWGVHVSGLVVPGQERGIFHAERRRDPFLVPEELLVDPEFENSAVKPYGTLANSVAGNFVGVDGSGAAAAPNGQGGVLVDNAAAATLVGAWSIDLDRQFYGNVISANGDPGSGGPGVLVTGQGTSVTVVAGNLIGLSADGQTALGNAGPGVKVADGALATNIGGDTYAANLGSRNYIAGNTGPGILIEDAFDFRRANVTTAPAGQELGDPKGALNNLTDTAAWNDAIGQGANYYMTAVVSNWIGLGVAITYENGLATAHTPIPLGNGDNADGILIVDSSNVLVGGAHPAWTRNVISANDGNGVKVTGDKSFLTFVYQDFIGTDETGAAGTDFGNGANGVLIESGAHHNAISGTGLGFSIFQATLDAGVASGGLGDFDPTETYAAWSAADLGNVISGNLGSGVRINGADYNRVAGGNFIGTNFGATAAVPNAGSGVLITGGASFNEITPSVRTEWKYFEGQADPQAWFDLVVQDMISGNLGPGVTIEGTGTSGNSVLGALIGVGYSTGNMIGLGNVGPGVLIRDGASENLIDELVQSLLYEPTYYGEVLPGVAYLRPTIVANGTSSAPRAGVEMTGAGTSGNQVKNSLIGTNELAATNLGNTGDGVLIAASASENLIGDDEAGNTIAANAARGVAIRGKNQAITAWSLDENGYLRLTLAALDGIAVDGTYAISGLTFYDEQLNSQAVTTATVVSINGSTIETNVLVTLTGTLTANLDAAYVVMEGANENTVRDNWIGTNQQQSDLGNAADGVLVTGSGALNWITDNRIFFNGGHGVALAAGANQNIVGTRIENEVTLGAANDIYKNGVNGVLITGSTYNILRANSITDNVASGVVHSGSRFNVVVGGEISANKQNGVVFTNGAEGNAVIGSDILNNEAHGVLIANGAEGNGVGVSINLDGAEGVPIATDPTAANTIRGNWGNQVRIAGESTKFNFVAGYNDIEAVANQDAIVIDGAVANVIGNGGEGQDPEGVYVVGANTPDYQNGNRVKYGAGNHGVAVYEGSNGAEGNAILGNAFLGDLQDAIFIDGYSGVVPPTIDDVTVTGIGPLTFDIDTSLASLSPAAEDEVRVDYYLVNPNNPLETHVLGSKVFTSGSSATFHVEGVTPSDTDLQGWYVTATATYDLQGDNELRIESVTSTLQVYVIGS
ncbi:MAG: right-handed parallel beta-helix repeat-containing protein [Pirellulales bacterium]|nr:right-handed parallel beta-helix repeat-containing protein [Pirellulales bacterium]